MMNESLRSKKDMNGRLGCIQSETEKRGQQQTKM